MLAIDAPAGSALHAWAAALPPGHAPVPVRVFAADDEGAVARAAAAVASQPELRLIAWLPLGPTRWWSLPADATALLDVRADAYASDPLALAQALGFVTREDRAARRTGPARLVVLGPLGMQQDRPAAGTTCVLQHVPGPAGEPPRTWVGRSPKCHLCIPQGHSDQSNLAPIHLVIEPTATGWIARDPRPTNGTWLGGVRLTEAPLHPGDELALCGLSRLRVDGAG
ncbi:MAG: FHA domain-containing protein [Kofleriaceae bacterium]|jgi:hypothetical protein|nr:FHA domain-containing protein [Kofleriaceae bacterium]MBP9205246.1 FHA domain-containing protein [Kofleriaceae bacterium]